MKNNLNQDKRQSKHAPLVFKCFSKEQIIDINTKIHDEFLVQKEDHSSSSQNVNKTGEFYHIPCLPFMEELHRWFWNCQRINTEVFGFDIYWNFHLDTMNYNMYGVGDEYEWHTDEFNFEASDMKLTCLLNLSEEPYEGGEFHINGSKDDVALTFEPGMGMIFHSPIAHKVTPVTKGERISLTYWGIGPAWK
jgi:PKHD-type hydroxylase